MDRARSVVATVPGSCAPVAGWAQASPAVPGTGPGSPRGGGCREGRSCGCVEKNRGGHAVGSASRTRRPTRSSPCAAARVWCAARRNLTEADLLPRTLIRGSAAFVEEVLQGDAQALVY